MKKELENNEMEQNSTEITVVEPKKNVFKKISEGHPKAVKVAKTAAIAALAFGAGILAKTLGGKNGSQSDDVCLDEESDDSVQVTEF